MNLNNFQDFQINREQVSQKSAAWNCCIVEFSFQASNIMFAYLTQL